MVITSLQVKHAVKNRGYAWFDGNLDYSNINLVGIRNLDKDNTVTNLFDDVMTLQFTLGGELQFYVWSCTTDPGKKGVMEYHNVGGVARLVEG